ncbi:hypothetical protein R1sor_005371 [Riccia sorocarpa]|uniref:NADP-dependent oxidoreductase domain-containing protein n=1 Tax=Riccia sorocarpa TaxID=122646 RepID=A0ABD3HN63_9MARC
MATVPKVPLGSQGLEVSAQGLGCLGMCGFYGPPKPEEEMIQLIHKAVEHGVTLLDTSDVYGPYTNEILLGKAIKGIRDKVQLSTKFASVIENGKIMMQIRGDPEHVRAACEGSLKRLGVDCIDLYFQHRVDSKVPIEITVGEMKKLVEEGKVKYIGLSEASAADIRRAHAIHPISAVQIEYSLWSRDVEEEIIPTCQELGIGIMAYSPLGSGLFSGKNVSEFADTDLRKVVFIYFLFYYAKELLDLQGLEPESCAELHLLVMHRDLGARISSITKVLREFGEAEPGKELHARTACSGMGATQGGCPDPRDNQVEEPGREHRLSEHQAYYRRHQILEDAVPAEEVKGDRCAHMSITWRFLNSPPLDTWTGTKQ